MEQVLLIIQREYIQRVRTRWFLISTLATPLLLIGLSLLPTLAARGGNGPRTVVIFDQSGSPSLFETIKQRVAAGGEASNRTVSEYGPAVAIPQFELSQLIVAPDKDPGTLMREQQAEIIKDPRRAFIILHKEILDGAEPEYYSSNIGDPSIRRLGSAIGEAVNEQRLVRAGIPPDKAETYLRSTQMKLFKIQSSGVTRAGDQSVLVGLFMFFCLFLTIYIYGHAVMQGVIEEKQSRIVEVMLSSIKPFSMMIGKIVGIGLVGITQYAIWVVSALVLMTYDLSLGGRMLPRLQLLDGWMLACFVIYFILGYFLFATLFAIIGSIVSRLEDAHQLQYLVTIMLAVPGIMFWTVMRDPNGARQIALSFVPFFTPTLMMLRLAVVDVPLWQVLLSIAVMVLTIIAGIWIASKIYRVGILMTGKRPSFPELGRWLRYQ